MRHFFTQNARVYFRTECLLHGPRDRSYHFEVCADIRNIPHPSDVAFGDDQGMAWRLWTNIEESNVIALAKRSCGIDPPLSAEQSLS